MDDIFEEMKNDACKILDEKEKKENIQILTEEEIRSLLHNLRVHQIELEIQNEELKRSQEELVLQRESYFHLFHKAPVGYALLDGNGIIRKANQLLCEILDFPRCDIINEPLSRYILEEDRVIYMSRFRAFFKKPEGKMLELRIKGKEEIIYMEIRGRKEVMDQFVFLENEKKVPLILITFNDITERKNAEAAIRKAMLAAEEANNTKSSFLATMSHELRTPLTSVIGFSDVLLRGDAGEINDEQRHYLTYIENSGTHLLNLINDLLDLSKIESGKMELNSEDVNLKNIFDEVENMVYPMASEKNISLAFNIESDDLSLKADSDKIKQIMINLLSNAIKFTPDSGSVDVIAKQTDDRIEISVKDTGIGIHPDYHSRIFESFSQVNSSVSKEKKGTGLGLALVRSFVEMHKGKIWLESEPGKGSKFSFSIPVEN